MTISEVIAKANAESMSVADALVANADQINNIPTDEPQALVEKLAETAKQDRCKVEDLAIPSDGRFTDREKTLLTPALIERAERLLQKQTKGKTPPTRTAPKAAIPTLPYNVKRDAKDRWWVVGMNGRKETGEEHGPFVTKKEAEAKRKEMLQSTPQATETTQAADESEPQQESETNQPVPETEENEMATKTKKTSKPKAAKQPKAKKAHASNGKPKKEKVAKPAKADGPAKVRYESSACFVAGEVIKRHGLEKGITQQMVDECTKGIGRKNERQDWFNLRNAWQAIRAYIGQPADGPK